MLGRRRRTGKEGSSTCHQLKDLRHQSLIDCFDIFRESVHDPTDRLAFKPPHRGINDARECFRMEVAADAETAEHDSNIENDCSMTNECFARCNRVEESGKHT